MATSNKKTGKKLDCLTIKGFKSIRELSEFKLKNLNVPIGGNGAGKSNFISFFSMMRAFMDGTLNRYVRDQGGACDLLFDGPKVTQKMEFEMQFGVRRFRFKLAPTPDNSFAVEDAALFCEPEETGWRELPSNFVGASHITKEIREKHEGADKSQPVFDAISSWQVYHFHDTGATAPMRGYAIVEDDATLRADAANIAPFLLRLKTQHPDDYKDIRNCIRLVIPFFDDFTLEPRKFGPAEKVNLSWRKKGSDHPFQPWHLSDGSMRFICLVAALRQPDPPATIIIDEPELGLHHDAIHILGEMVVCAPPSLQIILATQSALLLDECGIEDVVVVNRKDGAATFEWLKEKDYSEWLKSYSVGDLWWKNVIEAGPTRGAKRP